jgi:fumarate reductase subunit D
MVDREARDRILQIVKRNALSDIDHSDMMSIRSKDEAVEVFQKSHSSCSVQELDRWILFLQSDYEYRWGLTKVPRWSLLLLPVIIPVLVFLLCLSFAAAEQMQAVFARFGFETNIGFSLFIIVITVCLLLDVIHCRVTHRDLAVYPFYARDEYETATRMPG